MTAAAVIVLDLNKVVPPLRGSEPRNGSCMASWCGIRPCSIASRLATGISRSITRKPPDRVSFQVLPRRYVVEWAFGWMTRWRRRVRDYERRCGVYDAMIHVRMDALLLCRVAYS